MSPCHSPCGQTHHLRSEVFPKSQLLHRQDECFSMSSQPHFGVSCLVFTLHALFNFSLPPLLRLSSTSLSLPVRLHRDCVPLSCLPFGQHDLRRHKPSTMDTTPQLQDVLLDLSRLLTPEQLSFLTLQSSSTSPASSAASPQNFGSINMISAEQTPTPMAQTTVSRAPRTSRGKARKIKVAGYPKRALNAFIAYRSKYLFE